MSKNGHIISPTKDGLWTVRKRGSENRSIRAKTKVEAIIIGKVIRQRSGSEWVIDEKVEESSRK